MSRLIVVNNPSDWPLAIEGVQVVAAQAYLTDPEWSGLRGAKVFNLCRYYRYQSTGYYVSLLAEARGHKPMPSITTIQDLKNPPLVRLVTSDLDELVQRRLSLLRSDAFVLDVYFGHSPAARYEQLGLQLFKLFPSPFLRALFLRQAKPRRWQLQSVEAIPASELPGERHDFIIEAARKYFALKRPHSQRRVSTRYDLAVLHDPQAEEPPSMERTLKKFARIAEGFDFAVEFVTKEDYGSLAEYDALFIRETTGVNHYTYRFARRAAADGLVVIDDPGSILKCTNKVFLAELLGRRGIPTPRTVIVHRGNASTIGDFLGLPCILKQPDSSFSQGVVKADSPEALKGHVEKMLERSDLVIAQEFVPTPFDWRVTVLDRSPLFVCKYYMAGRHWQIIRNVGDKGRRTYGRVEAIAVDDAPRGLVRLALKAANLIGDGLYGVDLKQVGRKFLVIEINDNPNIDIGYEDTILGDELYRRLAEVFLRRVEARGRRGSRV